MYNKFKYYISPFFLNILQFIRILVKNANYRMLVKDNVKWRNKYYGEKVIIIANGPSLNNIDRNIISGKKVIVMNNFEKVDWKEDVEIVAHCIGEPVQSPSWNKEDVELSLLGTNSASYWLHYSAKDKFNNIIVGDKIHFAFAVFEPGIYFKKCIDLDGITLAYQTSAQLAIQVGIYMGFKEVALVGFDHDWLASPDYSKHCYSFEKDKSDLLYRLSYLDIILLIKKMWMIYYKIKKLAENNNVKIYNCSKPTYLDVFEQRDI